LSFWIELLLAYGFGCFISHIFVKAAYRIDDVSAENEWQKTALVTAGWPLGIVAWLIAGSLIIFGIIAQNLSRYLALLASSEDTSEDTSANATK
jgi:hypothetical protein